MLAARFMTEYVYSLHAWGKPDAPCIPGFDSETCRRIWDCMHTLNAEQRWGRVGLGIVERPEFQVGYDLHLKVTLETGEHYDSAWMWRDPQAF